MIQPFLIVVLVQMESLVAGAVQVLMTADTTAKAELTEVVAGAWQRGEIPNVMLGDSERETPPREPARPSDILLVEPRLAPKRGKGGMELL